MLKSGIYMQLAPVLFGRGVLAQAGEKTGETGITNALLVTDRTVLQLGWADRLASYLKAAGISVTLWAEVETDTPEHTVRAAAALARDRQADGVVAIGGGSTLDTAKAVSVIASCGEAILQEIPAFLSGQKRYPAKPLPAVLIPTTSGTGSEVTFVAVISSETLNCKIGLPCPPAYAILDPLLTVTMPPLVTAFTGMDAFSHACEALTERKNTPHSDLLSYEAIRLVSRWLPTAVRDGNNLEAREHLALASNYAGIAFNESGVHLGHSVAHALGHAYHLPHGICCALVTPAIVEFTAKTHPDKIKRMGEAMGSSVHTDDPAEIGRQVAGHVRTLLRQTGIPSLAAQGYAREQILAVKPSVYGEPLSMACDGTVTEQDVEDVLAGMYDHYRDECCLLDGLSDSDCG
ncbi:MAG: iron-containing alcohol dehydrogenase [Tannerella sp.]|jgi:alcohol dehydrogenase|nr:iron-containing alcohol dehydrogenase [Tannerella sp.]